MAAEESNTPQEITGAQEGAGPQEPPSGGRDAAPARGPASSPGLIDQLAERGFAVADGFIDASLLTQLRWRCSELHSSGALRPARIGRGEHARVVPEVRGDFISWVQQPSLDAEQQLLEKLDSLRVSLNRALMTGLADFEGHFAVYPPGSAYARHFDRLQGSDLRAISAVLYLNDTWTADDGGQLRLYLGGGRTEDVLPVGGRLVTFLSERFEHEVLPARRSRMSFTGWFRRRPLDALA